MIQEIENIDFREQFEALVQSGDMQKLGEFLDNQNISDVAELMDEYPDHEVLAISSMAIHRAARMSRASRSPPR